ncbi:hypothetical protein D3C77_354940 [compost metagenome]
MDQVLPLLSMRVHVKTNGLAHSTTRGSEDGKFSDRRSIGASDDGVLAAAKPCVDFFDVRNDGRHEHEANWIDQAGLHPREQQLQTNPPAGAV